MALERFILSCLYSAAVGQSSSKEECRVAASKGVATVSLEGTTTERSPGATVGADLGGSSKYSSENLED